MGLADGGWAWLMADGLDLDILDLDIYDSREGRSVARRVMICQVEPCPSLLRFCQERGQPRSVLVRQV
jgi:hypothetical protein